MNKKSENLIPFIVFYDFYKNLSKDTIYIRNDKHYRCIYDYSNTHIFTKIKKNTPLLNSIKKIGSKYNSYCHSCFPLQALCVDLEYTKIDKYPFKNIYLELISPGIKKRLLRRSALYMKNSKKLQSIF